LSVFSSAPKPRRGGLTLAQGKRSAALGAVTKGVVA